MKYKDWSNFVVPVTGINSILSRPTGARDLTKQEKRAYDKFLSKPELDEDETLKLERMNKKIDRFKDPELSQSAIKYLLKRYSWEKYHSRIAAIGMTSSYAAKGNAMESEGIKLLSNFDQVEYKKSSQLAKNDYMIGQCDVFCTNTNKIVDVKTSWSINSFLPGLYSHLDRKYWYQMQGYLELYNCEYGEVCFVLMNTPIHLVERERAKYTEKYVFGEIPRERYDEEMEKLDLAFSYNKIPTKRRIIRFEIKRCPEVIPLIYKRVEKCREWLNAFERIHLHTKKIITLPEYYAATTTESKDDNFDPDSADLREGDAG
jgi:hypothetical protein